jgi:UDP-N-acetylmuramoyl-tripeptide--D-alanyl-D-alanine ligase
MHASKPMTNLAQIHAMLPKSHLMNIGIDEARDLAITKVSSDSRKLESGELFIALKGDRFDAHHYLSDVHHHGAAAALISDDSLCPKTMPAVYVADTRESLGELASAWRKQYAIPLVVVTGSNGKTTVKEMIASIFKEAAGPSHTLMTEGNLNNEIGLPLTLLRLRPEHQLAVIELGMNHPGETAQLAAIAKANIALINNAQREHQEFMESIAAVADEHAAVILALPADGIAVFPADTPYTSVWKKAANTRKLIDFAWQTEKTEKSSAVVRGYALKNGAIQIQSPAGEIEVKLQTLGEHNCRNALAACAVALAAGVSLEKIRVGLEKFRPVSGRMQVLQLNSTLRLIDDSYNANPDSVVAAIDALAQHSGERYLILGDMGEVGTQGPAFHEELGLYAARSGVENLLTLGELSRLTTDAYLRIKQDGQAKHYSELAELNQDLQAGISKCAAAQTAPITVLVKGSRFMRMERLVEALQQGAKACS